LRSKITDKKIIGQKFRRGQKFRLTPGYRNLLNRTHRRTGRHFTGGTEKICLENNNFP